MKKIAFIMLALFLSVSYVSAQGKAEAKFQKTTHDFGKIAESIGTATCEFIFTNTGNAPLIINRVATTCGCTTPSYTKEPILPGKDGKIVVSYSTKGRIGSFNKGATVFTNVPDSVYTLIIKGEVLSK
ncbi:DUF1573 domain-containing protein [Dysgonomonas sp. 520]|uniref:DUF1573 domain-containing protein n=1 Tax=Dysgonomonas sp. 520 TaxID=2302931 RepID=UPI0013D50394|nr:DUF1573 domain-containing protein [Dysgonomonas sp. 520]NDW09393.1 DUF1573 domain-containing protein [Dysgonomonas sp. 520]